MLCRDKSLQGSVLTGKKTLETALGETLKRSAKAGVSVGVGSVVMLLDGGIISIPATREMRTVDHF